MQVSATCDAPCKDCPDRSPHCHSICELYRNYKKTLEENRSVLHARTEEANFIRELKKNVRKLHLHKQKADER